MNPCERKKKHNLKQKWQIYCCKKSFMIKLIKQYEHQKVRFIQNI